MLAQYSSRKAVGKIKTRFPFLAYVITRYWGIDPHPLCSGINWQGKEPICRTSVCLDKAWTVCVSAASLHLSVICKLVEFRKRHRFEASVVFFSSLFWSPPVKMPFSSTLGLQGLSHWMLSDPSNPAAVCLKHLGSETTCAGTILLHALPEWTVKMFLTHNAMEEMLCSTTWKYSQARQNIVVKVA